MRAEELTEDNLEDFSDHIDPEEAENIGRDTYRGLAITTDSGDFNAGAIWEVKYLENEEKDTVSRLSWVSTQDSDSADELLNAYTEMVQEDMVVQTSLELFPDAIDETVLGSHGFEVIKKEGSNIIISVGDLANLKLMHLNKIIPSYVTPLTDVREREFKRGLMNCMFRSKRELTEDLPYLPIEWYEPNLSCYVATDGKIEGYLLVHQTATDRLRVELLIDVGCDAQVELLNMVRFSMKQAVANYPPETKIVLRRSDNATQKLVAFLFPNVKGEQMLTGERKEPA